MTISRPDSTYAPRPRTTYVLLSGLYVSQFVGTGFFATALTTILRDRGAPLADLGLLQLVLMISVFRLLWAPLVDRFGSARRGHYRSWLLVLQPAIVLALLSMALVQPGENLGFLLFVGFVVAVLSATQDIAVDAIAIRLLHTGRRGLANGIQVAGGYVGSLVGGGLSLVVYEHIGWAAAVLVLALTTALPAVHVFRYREPPRPDGPAPSLRASIGTVFSLFRRPHVCSWVLVVLPLYWTGTYAAYSLVAPMLVDAGWPTARIGMVMNVLSSLVAIAGAIGAGGIVARLGVRRCLVLFGLVQLAAIFPLVPLALGYAPVVATAVAVCVLKVAFAASSTVIGTVSMGLSRTETAGADYSALACMGSAIAFAAGAAGLTLAGRVGYFPVLVAAIGIAFCGVVAAQFTNAARVRSR